MLYAKIVYLTGCARTLSLWNRGRWLLLLLATYQYRPRTLLLLLLLR